MKVSIGHLLVASFVFASLPFLFAGETSAQTSGQVPASTWNQFRGPVANPATDNAALPDRWTKTENVEWRTELEGRGWSSPIVIGEKVFVTSAETDGESKDPQVGVDYSNDYVRELSQQGLSEEEIEKKVMERDFELPSQVSLRYYLICLDLNSGKVLWKTKFFEGNPPGGRHRKNSFASETPTTDGKAVFVYIGNLGLYAFDLDGKQTWNTEIEAKKVYMEFGTGTSPVMCDGKLIVLNDNEEASFIAAYDPSSGKEVWKTERTRAEGVPAAFPKSSWVTPFVWKNKMRTEIITMQPGTAISYGVDGKELWRMNGCSPAPSASSFAHDGTLYVNGGRGRPIVAIQPGASGEVEMGPAAGKNDSDADAAGGEKAEGNASLVSWNRPRTGTYIPTPVIYDGGMFIVHDNGILQRLDAATGNQSYKKRIKNKGADFTTSPWCYNGRLFCLSEQGDTYVFETGEEFKLLHVNSLDEFTMASPAIVGDRLLVRTEDAVYSIRKK